MPNSFLPFRVISFGGVGSKLLTKAIYASLNEHQLEVLERAHSHASRAPSKLANPTQRIIYMFGDPRNAVISFFNRRFRRHERHNFSASKHAKLPAYDWAMQHAANLNVDVSPMTAQWTLPDYCAHGSDLFCLNKHFKNWTRAICNYPVTFVRYETIWQNTSKIADLLDIDYCDLPLEVPRSADWRREEQRTAAALTRIYSPQIDDQLKLGDVFTVPPGESAIQIRHES